MPDQQRGDCLSAEGHPVLRTPNMDSIAANGMRFTRAYSPCPSCIAARRSLLAGQEPFTAGMVGYRDGVEWDAPPTLPGALRDAGYQTHIVGRSMHQHPPRKRHGYEGMEIYDHTVANDYEEWLAAVGPRDAGGWMGGGVMHNDYTARPWQLEDHLHFTNWTVTRALEFLRRRDPSCPFFLTVSFIAPHPPLQPPAFYFERYLRTGVPEPVIGDWATPPTYGCDEGSVAPGKLRLTGEQLLSTRAAYYGSINHIDDQIRRLTNPVRNDWINNTILVFTADHGEMLGDHYFWRKQVPFEPSSRVPLLISAPKGMGLKRGAVADQVAGLQDVMPTLLDMVGVEIPSTVEGRSLLPILRGESPAWRKHLHIEHAPDHQTLTDGREKFIWWVKDGREQLFDLTADPTECHDLASEPAKAERMTYWRRELIQKLKARPEGFTDGEKLIPGRTYKAVPPAGS